MGRAGLYCPFILFAVCLSCTRGHTAPVESRPHSCELDDLPGKAVCATYTVWENRDRRSGRRIPINIAILPALSSPREPDPLFVLAGGPGQAATTLAGAFFKNRELRARREIVFIDQRGTGGSNPLPCDLERNLSGAKRILAGPFPLDAVRTCRQRLSAIADLTQYTTAAAMDDVDDVRSWLGYDRVNLWGGSYGTRAAQVYLRRHGAHVRSVILMGVLPVDEIVPLHQSATADRAIKMLFDRYAAQYPNLDREFRSLLDAAGPAALGLSEGVRHALYSDTGASFPQLIHRAAAGDRGPLEERAIAAEEGLSTLATGLNLSVTCAEDIPFLDDATIARETAGTYFGDLRIQRQRAACREWVRGAVPADVHEPVRSDVPVLLLSGDRDPVTPPEFAEHVAASLTRTRHAVFADSAHGNFGPCANQMMATFIASADPAALNTSCAQVK